MQSFSSTIASGVLPNLSYLDFSGNQIGNAGIEAFASAVAGGALASLLTLTVDDGTLGAEHPQLKDACEARGIGYL